MVRAITKLFSLSVLVTIGIVGILLYRSHTANDRQTAELMKENDQLNQVVTRLTDERRVAEMLVTDQKIVNGIPKTTLLFVEYARDRTALAPKQFTIVGNQVHLDAMVIKFQRDFVKQNDPLRGHSIALFTRLYGNRQSPDDGTMIDATGQIPAYYQGGSSAAGSFEMGLWKSFWQLAKDSAYRQQMGVRVSNGQGLWWNCDASELYTITIEADGGLNVTTEPVKPIYKAALQK